jgi:hypothetical protein
MTTPAPWFIDEAGPQDDSILRRIAREGVMPGPIRVAFAREPDFFAALAVEGRSRRVMVARRRDTGEPVGFGVVSCKPVWMDGEPRVAGYLSGLRIRPEWRGGRLLAAGYRHVFAGKGSDADVHLTTILESNVHAQTLLSRRRRTLPAYQPGGRVQCRACPPRRRIGHAPPPGARIETARPGDLPSLFAFLEREGRRHQFFPRYQPGDLKGGGLLQGLRCEDIILLWHGDAIRGCMGLWDQRAFRQTLVEAYPALLRRLRPMLNRLPSGMGLPRLPPAGQPVRLGYAALVCAADDDAAAYAALFDAIRHRAVNRFDLMVAGAHESHPFSQIVRTVPGLRFDSRLYSVAASTSHDDPIPPGAADDRYTSRPAHYE